MVTSAHQVRARLALLLALGTLAAAGCSDSNGPKGSDEPEVLPDPTPKGTPTGSVVAQTIGAQGGSLTSADGGLTLTVPAGAVAAPTEFSVQPVTNTMPTGVGPAYRLTPKGVSFAAPVKLSFRYTDDALTDGGPGALGIAYQDASGVWWGRPSSTVDRATRTITVSTTRLGAAPSASARSLNAGRVAGARAAGAAAGDAYDWAAGYFGFMLIEQPRLKVGQSSVLTVILCLQTTSQSVSGKLGEDDLATLPRTQCSNKPADGTWSVNGIRGGDGTVGTVATGSLTPGNVATYTAPGRQPQPGGFVTVEAEVTWIWKTKARPAGVGLREIVSGRIRVDPTSAQYHVTGVYTRDQQPVLGGYGVANVRDTIQADVIVQSDRTGTVAPPQNVRTSIDRLLPAYPDQTCALTVDGPIEQFTAQSGGVAPDPAKTSEVQISFAGTYAEPSFTVGFKTPDGRCDMHGFDAITGQSGIFFSFDASKLAPGAATGTYTAPLTGWTFTVTLK